MYNLWEHNGQVKGEILIKATKTVDHCHPIIPTTE